MCRGNIHKSKYTRSYKASPAPPSQIGLPLQPKLPWQAIDIHLYVCTWWPSFSCAPSIVISPFTYLTSWLPTVPNSIWQSRLWPFLLDELNSVSSTLELTDFLKFFINLHNRKAIIGHMRRFHLRRQLR